MSWLGIPWSEGIKKRACRYLLQRYLGQFLEEKLTLDQLSVDLYNGTGCVTEVKLDVQALNDLGEQYGLPLQFVDGFITKMRVNIPWASLLNDASYVEVTGLMLTVQPKQRNACGVSMADSVWNSMTSSIQLAQQCLQPDNASSDFNLEGVELFAQQIDTILSRVKIRFLNTVIRLEHVPLNSSIGVGLEIKISNFEYSDEAGNECLDSNVNYDVPAKDYLKSFSVKHIFFEGVSFYTDEFPSYARTFSRSVMNSSNRPERQAKGLSQATITAAPTLAPIFLGKKFKEHSVKSACIVFAKLCGSQEVRLKVKQFKSIPGPSIETEVTLGVFMCFLSPRQVHLLLELIHGLSSPDLEDVSNVPTKICLEKPMVRSDYNQIEQELLNQVSPDTKAQDLNNRCGWSSKSSDKLNTQEIFLPMKSSNINYSDTSDVKKFTISDESMILGSNRLKESFSKSEMHQTLRSKNEPTLSKNNNFQVRVSSVVIVLIHEDILCVESEYFYLSTASINLMRTQAEEFLYNSASFCIAGLGGKNFQNLDKFVAEACNRNHFRFVAVSFVFGGTESLTSEQRIFSGMLSIASLEVLECLLENNLHKKADFPTIIKLLSFTKASSGIEELDRSCTDFNLKYEDVKKVVKHSNPITYTGSRLEFEATLQQCQGELDITIIDRISDLLNSKIDFANCSDLIGKKKKQGNIFHETVGYTSAADYGLVGKLKMPKYKVQIRFPIPDLRPASHYEESSWKSRSIRPDYITLTLVDLNANCSANNRDTGTLIINIQSKSVFLHYTEANSEKSIKIADATSVHREKGELNLNKMEDFDYPKIVLKIFPAYFNKLFDDSFEQQNSNFFENFENSGSCQPSPFSSKKVIHKSSSFPSPGFDSHQKKSKYESFGESEELLIPGTKEEIMEFIEDAAYSSRCHIYLGLPCLSVVIPSKHIFELLYNRFTSDFFLWQSRSSKIQFPLKIEKNVGLDLASTIFQSCSPRFISCKSTTEYESDSESDEGIFYSTTENSKNKDKHNQISKNGQSKFALTLNVLQAVLKINTSKRDCGLSAIPNKYGEIFIKFGDLVLFYVSHYRGDKNLGLFCALAGDVSLHHVKDNKVSFESNSFESYHQNWPNDCYSAIYKTESGANIFKKNVGNEMIRVAMRIQGATDVQIKNIQIAAAMINATFKYQMAHKEESWFSQMIDYLDIVDYPVLGYLEPSTLIEFYFHTWNCCIDYRPLNLPLKSLVSIGSFCISSNIAAQTSTSTLQFLAEDFSLYISNKFNNILDLKKDYILVLYFGLFELCLRLTGKKGGTPKVDLKATNDIIHIHTCSDSCLALMQLLTYFASDGDLIPDDAKETMPQLYSKETCRTNSSIRSEASTVNKLMAEAIEDTEVFNDIRINTLKNVNEVEVFLFPDESKKASFLQRNKTAAPHNSFMDYIQVDEDFCILGEEAGVGILPRNGIPDVRMLYENSFEVVNNHFPVPITKMDLLKAPKKFPLPELRYTLCEMTLVWYLYGGNDFNDMNNTIHSSPTNRKSEIDNNQSSLQKLHHKKICASKHKDTLSDAEIDLLQNKWHTAGGPGRRHDIVMQFQLNKVRFQHEIYPKTTLEASRQIILINEFEIRDRLASSHINKFLYQYNTELRPRQSHANMFTAKAIHIRPDPKLSTEECSLKLSLLPLRLNIDQDSLLFLISFFSDLTTRSKLVQNYHIETAFSPSRQRIITEIDDMALQKGNDEELNIPYKSESFKNDNLLAIKYTGQKEERPIYFRRVSFKPEVLIRLDYHGKRVDLTHGPLAGLLMGLAQLSCSELKLRSLTNQQGILGVDRLVSFIFSEWLFDIKKTQLPNLLGGVGPMHSLLQLFHGIKDLFWLPIEQYQKDGRIVRGLQRGANSFTTSTAMAALELTSRLISLVQTTAETTYDIVNYGPSVKFPYKGQKIRKKHWKQPSDIREGVTTAFTLVKEGLGETANQLVRIASEEHEHKGVSGAVGGVLRQIPPTVVKPIILATEATNNVLGGMKSQLLPDAKKEASQKWRKEHEN